VTDRASGFKGKAVHLTLHINGCIHALVQPKGPIPKTGDMIEAADFDIRRLSGKNVPKLTEPEMKKSVKKHPSPAGMTPFIPKMSDTPRRRM
jgi:hypothetical protein